MEKPETQPKPAKPAEDKQARLSAALRANLQRRKAAAAAKDGE